MWRGCCERKFIGDVVSEEELMNGKENGWKSG